MNRPVVSWILRFRPEWRGRPPRSTCHDPRKAGQPARVGGGSAYRLRCAIRLLRSSPPASASASSGALARSSCASARATAFGRAASPGWDLVVVQQLRVWMSWMGLVDPSHPGCPKRLRRSARCTVFQTLPASLSQDAQAPRRCRGPDGRALVDADGQKDGRGRRP